MQRHLRSLQGGFGGKNRSLSGSESDIARHDSMLDASRIRTHTHTHIYIYIRMCLPWIFSLARHRRRLRRRIRLYPRQWCSPDPPPSNLSLVRLLDPSFGSIFWIRLLDPSFGSFVAAVTRGSGAGPIRPTPITGLDIVPSLYDPVLAVKMSVWCMCVGVLPIVALT